MTAALALAVLEAIGPHRRHHHGAEARARLYAAQVELAAAASRIDPYLVVALIERESDWDPRAIGDNDEVGLMQILPFSEAAGSYRGRPWALFQTSVNIHQGVIWMAIKRQICRTSDPLKWLSAYKGGACRATPYSRWIVARAGVLRGMAGALAMSTETR